MAKTFLRRILDLFRPSLSVSVRASKSPENFYASEESSDLAIAKYPPSDQGIRLTSVESLIDSQKDLINRIFRTAGVSRQEFAERYIPPINNLARHVHCLPATATTYFRGTGGLFRMSLEIGLNSLQSANAAVFPTGGGVERRYHMAPKWTLATFLAGLCSQNYRTVNSMAVLTKDNVQWTPLMTHLYDWVISQQVNLYFIRWLDDAQITGAQASAAYSINQIVPLDILTFLADGNNQVVQSMTAAIAGVEISASENPISRLVAPVVTRVIEDDLNRSATHYGHLVIGAHLEPHLLDSMRCLVRSGKWIVNHQQSGRVWAGKEGVFVDWIPASQDIANLLAKNSFAGVSKDPDTLADLLVHAGLLEMTTKGARYWTISLPETFEAKEGMVRMKRGGVIFPDGFDLSPFANVQLTLEIQSTQPIPLVNATNQTAPVQPKPSTIVAPLPLPQKAPPSAPEAPEPTQSKAPRQQRKPKSATPEVASKTELETKSESESESINTTMNEIPPDQDFDSRYVRVGSEDYEPDYMAGQPEPEVVSVAPPTKVAVDKGVRQKLLGSLKSGNAILLGDIIENAEKKNLTGIVVALEQGVGISNEELSAHGQPVMDLFKELGTKHWLWIDRTKPSRMIHQVQVDGRPYAMMILKAEIAAGLGLGD